MLHETVIRCDVIDCIHTKDGYCTLEVIDIEFYKQDNIHEYAICKDYEQEDKQ